MIDTYNLIELVEKCSSIPSFTTFEDRICRFIEDYVSSLPVSIVRIPENNIIISWNGNNKGSPLALTAHLDKINHFGCQDIDSLNFSFDSDEIVGQLDDSVGIAICLNVLSECIHIRNCPPIIILLSEMEEKSSYKHKDLLKKCGSGIELAPGAHKISDYLINHNLLPEAVITIDTSPVFQKTGGIAIYYEFWDQFGIDPSSPKLQTKSTELLNRIHSIDTDVYLSNGVNDYITYGMRLNEKRGSDIPSIAIEPAIWPMHTIGERMKIIDIHRVNKILIELIKTWESLTG